jgi:predicted RNase H-like HicB family nuclease
MRFRDYKAILYRQKEGSWAAEIPAISGCYARMPTRAEALGERANVFDMIAEEYRDKGRPHPAYSTEIAP